MEIQDYNGLFISSFANIIKGQRNTEISTDFMFTEEEAEAAYKSLGEKQQDHLRDYIETTFNDIDYYADDNIVSKVCSFINRYSAEYIILPTTFLDSVEFKDMDGINIIKRSIDHSKDSINYWDEEELLLGFKYPNADAKINHPECPLCAIEDIMDLFTSEIFLTEHIAGLISAAHGADKKYGDFGLETICSIDNNQLEEDFIMHYEEEIGELTLAIEEEMDKPSKMFPYGNSPQIDPWVELFKKWKKSRGKDPIYIKDNWDNLIEEYLVFLRF